MAYEIRTKKVQNGDCAWNAAKRNLQAQNKKPTNADIAKEMNRLAKLNGCKDADDFNSKFFAKANKEYVVEKKKTTQQKPVYSNDTTAMADSTRVTKKPLPQPKKAPATAKSDSTTVKSDSTKVKTPKDSTTVKKQAPVAKKAENPEIAKINSMKSDRARIVEYNKKNYNGQYYGIVDKKTCKLNIYNKQGEIVKSFNVGVGKTKGDNVGSYYLERAEKTKDAWKAESQRYTTAGEFTLDERKSASANYIGKNGEPKLMDLKGDNKGIRSGQKAIHMIPKNHPERISQLKNRTNTRVSYGCVNLLEEDYDAMHQYLGEGDKIYILPEEKGNKLQLERQKDGTYKFEQAYHKKAKRGMPKEEASKVNYDIRPDKNPAYIAQQKAKKEAQAKLMAQRKAQQKAQEKAKETKWYNPTTWFA